MGASNRDRLRVRRLQGHRHLRTVCTRRARLRRGGGRAHRCADVLGAPDRRTLRRLSRRSLHGHPQPGFRIRVARRGRRCARHRSAPLQIPALFVILLAATSLGIYGVRGIYFSVMNEMRLPLAITGSAVGLVSVIGFTPDIFAGPAIGALLDRDPGAVGHHHVFLMMAAFALIGLIASLTLLRLTRAAKRDGHAMPPSS